MSPEQIIDLGIYGSLASLIGFPIAILGIGLAYQQLVKTRRASEAAESAVSNFREDLSQTFCLSDLAKALTGIEELKRLFRIESYTTIPDRLSDVRHTLISARGMAKDLSKEELINFQSVISDLSTLEKRVQLFLSTNISPKNLQKNAFDLLQRADTLHELMTRLKNQVGIKRS